MNRWDYTDTFDQAIPLYGAPPDRIQTKTVNAIEIDLACPAPPADGGVDADTHDAATMQ